MSLFTNSSPDISTREIDLTNAVGATGTSAGAFAGNFHWGPVEVITQVSGPNEIEAQFGKPSDENFADWFSAANFLAYTGALQLVRAIDEDALNSTDDGDGILIKNSQHYQVVQSAPTSVKFAARYPGALGDSISVHVADASTYDGWAYEGEFDFAPGTSEWAASIGASNDEVHVIVIDRLGQFGGVVGGVLERYAFASKASDSKDGDAAPNFYVSRINKNSQYVYAMSVPTGAEVEVPASDKVGTVTVSAGGQDYTTASVTFAPAPAGGTTAQGTATIAAGVVTAIVVTSAGSGYTTAPTVTITGDGTGATATAALAVITNAADWGTKGVVNGVGQVFKGLVARLELPLSGGKDATSIGAQELIRAYQMFANQEEADVALIFTGAAGGENAHTVVNQWVIDNLGEGRKDCVTFHSPKLADVLNKTQSQAVAAVKATRNAIGRSSSYAVMDSGWKLQYDVYNDKMRWVPLNADLAGLCARVDTTNDPWNSPGGYTRGRLLNVVSLAWNPDKPSRDAIYKVGINPVVTFNVDGTILYGDKTMLGKNSAFSQIGVRRLFIMLKRDVSQAAKQYLFESNNQFTRASFVNMTSPRLEEVRGRGGIEDGRVVCDESNNGPEIRMNKQFVGSIFVKPTYSINWIQLNFVAVRQDVAFEEVVNVQF